MCHSNVPTAIFSGTLLSNSDIQYYFGDHQEKAIQHCGQIILYAYLKINIQVWIIQFKFQKKLIKSSYSTGVVAPGLFHFVRISHLVVSVSMPSHAEYVFIQWAPPPSVFKSMCSINLHQIDVVSVRRPFVLVIFPSFPDVWHLLLSIFSFYHYYLFGFYFPLPSVCDLSVQ